ncbi:MAG: MBL fold metallo-hydrolase [Mesorhizobium sp.]|nr:MBL fold metallo-hydrolase [Mesorhizobium sp.]
MTESRAWSDLVGDESGLAVEVLGHGVFRLSERVVSLPERSYFYLVEGDGRDCLIDGGWGFAASLDGLRRDPRRPLVAVATHSHFDHIGALHLAERRYGHGAEAAVFAAPDPRATQALPWLDGLDTLAGGGGIAASTIRQTPCPLHELVGDGDRIDLGGRTLDILHTPGHSPGSLCVLDSRSGFLFCADTVHDGHIFDDIPGADRAALLLSHQRLASVDFVRALPGHGALLSPVAFRERIARFRRNAA